jgi:peptidoglycan/LPS O-acetylase OafA/YrhL
MPGEPSAEATQTPGREPSGVRLPYLPALDGLRALAVLSVILYHADMPGVPGGFLGVEVFFVISGYLITALLLAEWLGRGRIDFKAFWLRRARRLLPALYVLLLAVLTFAVLFLPEQVAGLRGDTAAALAYVTNWYLIFSHKSYFEMVGRPSLLRHLWSLAVEEQFYLLWPLIFTGLLVWLKPRRALIAIGAGIVVSTLLMAGLYQPEVDPSRVYYGTDTRAAGLLLGAALAFVWVPGRDYRPGLPTWAIDAAGIAGLTGLFLACALINEYDPFLYRGGFLLVGLCTVALIAASVHPRARRLHGIMGWPPLVWVGVRSYGIYLWHWPVCMLTRPQLDTPLTGLPLLALRLALTFILAELSYRFIEMPVRRGVLGRAFLAVREAQGSQRRNLRLRWGGMLAGLLALMIVLGTSMVMAQPPATPEYLALESINTLETPQTGLPGGRWSSQGQNGQRFGWILSPPSTPVRKSVSLKAPGRHLVQMPLVAVPPAPATALAPARSVPRATVEVDPALRNPIRGRAMFTWPRTLSTNPTPWLQTSPIATPPPLGAKPVAARPVAQPTIPPAIITSPTPAGVASAAASPTVTATQTVEGPSPMPTTVITEHISFIGDSVMLGAAAPIRALGNTDIDARVGRQVGEAYAILRNRLAAGTLGPIVVLHIGNNGTLTVKQFDDTMALLVNTRQVIFLTIKVPRAWAGPNNKVLTEGVARYPNATLVDWQGITRDHPEFFWSDGMHLRPEGARFYTDLVISNIKRP